MSYSIIEAIGWTLVHFLWQGCLIAVVIAALLTLLRRSNPQTRYLIGCCGLLLMISSALFTGIWQCSQVEAQRGAERVAEGPTSNQIDRGLVAASVPGQGQPMKRNAQSHSSSNSTSDRKISHSSGPGPPGIAATGNDASHWLKPVVAIWLAGVLLLAIRLVGGCWRTRRWKMLSNELTQPDFQAKAGRLAERMGIGKPPPLRTTTQLHVPAVIGWLRPAILIPASSLTCMPVRELEAIIAHELAHIQRKDWIMNLIQSSTETVLFYHPAVWWLSHQIRIERENCCDDLAVEACGSKSTLARALASVESQRCSAREVSLAADGGSLVERIRRLAGEPSHAPVNWHAGMLVLSAFILASALLWTTGSPSVAQQTEKSITPILPKKTHSQLTDPERSAIMELLSNTPNHKQTPQDPEIRIREIERDNERLTRAIINAFEHGRSATELVRHFAAGGTDIRHFLAGSTTNMESIVSATGVIEVRDRKLIANEIHFNLPEGSDTRAEFSGEEVHVRSDDDSAVVTITNGSLELIDGVGVIRASARPTGNEAQLVIECRESGGEVVMKIRSISSDGENPQPVSVTCNVDSGAPENEEDPPHGSIRYEIQHGVDDGQQVFRMKMKWRYIMKRLLEEAMDESGHSMEDLIYGPGGVRRTDSLELRRPLPPPRVPADRQPEAEAGSDAGPPQPTGANWGPESEAGLSTRLTVQSSELTAGTPLLLKLEMKNFSDQPVEVDMQYYYPFRVLKAAGSDGESLRFVGNTAQTSQDMKTLQPGESILVWENIDASGMYLMQPGQIKFRVTGGRFIDAAWPRNSNLLELELLAGESTPENELVAELANRIPDDWDIMNGMQNRGSWKGIYLHHSPSGLKRDVTSIRIWFTDESLPEDFKAGNEQYPKVVHRIGEGPAGYVNVATPPETATIWPEYETVIREVVHSVMQIRNEDE